MSIPAFPTPQQQPTPTGTTPPGKRRLAVGLFVAIALIVGWQLFFPSATKQGQARVRDNGKDQTASEEQIAAAKLAAKYETEQIRQEKEREDARKRALGKGEEIKAMAAKPPIRKGGGGSPQPKTVARSIVFDFETDRPGNNQRTPLAQASYRGDDPQERALAIARQLMAESRANGRPQPSALPTTVPNGQRQSEPADEKSPHLHLLNPDPNWERTVLPEDTVIEGVLKNRLEGANDGPVDVMVTTNVYQRGTHRLIFPAGTNIAGETKHVALLNQERMAVVFHRALVELSDGSGYGVELDAPALDQAGAVALHDKVNHHYLEIFGGALAIGAIGGLANIGNSYGGASGYDTLSSIRSGIGTEMGMSSQRIMQFFLNKLPTIVIREGTRVKIILIGDLPVPFYPEEMEDR